MTCYHPLKAYRSSTLTDSGKRAIVFSPKDAYLDQKLEIPCGQCVGCRLERSRQWAIRCVHEASLYEDNCFITLTYSDEYIPSDRSLHVDHFQKFMKRLRKRFGDGIRFYHCGEYGEKFFRPHYHACLFNFDFKDKKLWKIVNDQRLYISESLSQLWPYGFVTIGSVTFESAAYVARYIMKKINGDMKQQHYERYDTITGEVYQLKPEYTTMSRRPGIGKAWYDKFGQHSRDHDFVVMRGVKMKPPKYYDKLYEIAYPSDFATTKSKRIKIAKKHLDNNTVERLFVRETIQKEKLKKLPRIVE